MIWTMLIELRRKTILKSMVDTPFGYLIINRILNALVPIAFRNKNYWNDNKSRFLKSLIDKIEKYYYSRICQNI